MRLKTISNILFGLALLSMILYKSNSLMSFITRYELKILIGIFGFFALFLNLLNYKNVRNKKRTNLLYSLGVLIIAMGFTMQFIGFYYSLPVIFAGIILTGISFFYNPTFQEKESETSELLDNES
jgi:hypothetical protein